MLAVVVKLGINSPESVPLIRIPVLLKVLSRCVTAGPKSEVPVKSTVSALELESNMLVSTRSAGACHPFSRRVPMLLRLENIKAADVRSGVFQSLRSGRALELSLNMLSHVVKAGRFQKVTVGLTLLVL